MTGIAGDQITNGKLFLHSIFLALLALLLYYVSHAVLAYSGFSFALLMDERITYEPIHKALTGGWLDKLFFLFDGHDTRYGRLLWNLDFVASYAPFRLFGEQGQIIATRFAHVLILAVGYFVLVWSLVSADLLRMLCFLCLVLLPQSFYYFLMPKPEPLIVLLLACLIYFLVKGKTRYYFLFIGMLAGLKISTMPICGILFIAYFAYLSAEISIRDFLKDLGKMFSARWIGIYLFITACLACLVTNYVKEVYYQEVYSVLTDRRILRMNAFHLFVAFNAFVAAFFIMITWLYFRRSYGKLSFISQCLVQLLAGLAFCNTYLYFTPFNILLYVTTPITHGADNPAITVVDWLVFIFRDVFFSQAWLPGLLLVSVALLVISFARSSQWRSLINRHSTGVLLILLALVNLVPVIFFTKRLWGFYLLVPMVLLLVYLASSLDKAKHRTVKVVGAAFLAGFLLMGFNGFKKSVSDRQEVVKHADFLDKKTEYFEVCSTINNMSRDLPPAERKAYWDPKLFFPDCISDTDIKIIWGPFKAWHEGRKFVVLSDYPDRLYTLDRQNKNYDKFNESISQYRSFTDSINGTYSEYRKGAFKYFKVFIRN